MKTEECEWMRLIGGGFCNGVDASNVPFGISSDDKIRALSYLEKAWNEALTVHDLDNHFRQYANLKDWDEDTTVRQYKFFLNFTKANYNKNLEKFRE